MIIEQWLNLSADAMEKMTDAELLDSFKDSLVITRSPVDNTITPIPKKVSSPKQGKALPSITKSPKLVIPLELIQLAALQGLKL